MKQILFTLTSAYGDSGLIFVLAYAEPNNTTKEICRGDIEFCNDVMIAFTKWFARDEKNRLTPLNKSQ